MALPAPGIVRAASVAMHQLADRDTPFVKNEWYVAAFAAELQRSLLKRTVLGQRLVMYRTLAGVPVALDDRCAHRSFPLSSGLLDGDTVICGYHGLRYDAKGDCIEVPSQKVCPKGIGVRAFPLVERGPFVWAWFGDTPADPSRIPATPWLESGEWVSSQGYFHLPGNYVSLHENLLDLTHLSYVHASSFGTPDYAAAPYETNLRDGHFEITRRVVPTQLPPVWAQAHGAGARSCGAHRDVRVRFARAARRERLALRLQAARDRAPGIPHQDVPSAHARDERQHALLHRAQPGFRARR